MFHTQLLNDTVIQNIQTIDRRRGWRLRLKPRPVFSFSVSYSYPRVHAGVYSSAWHLLIILFLMVFLILIKNLYLYFQAIPLVDIFVSHLSLNIPLVWNIFWCGSRLSATNRVRQSHSICVTCKSVSNVLVGAQRSGPFPLLTAAFCDR